MSTPLPLPEKGEDEPSSSSTTALRIRQCDDEEEEVEVLLIESDGGEGTQTRTAKDNVEVIDVDSDSDVILVDSGEEVEVDGIKRPTYLEHRHLFECPSCDFVTDSHPLAVQHTQRSLIRGSAAASSSSTGSSSAATAVGTDHDSRKWRLHDVNSKNIQIARDRLTRALKRQVTAPAWKLIRNLNVAPIGEKDNSVVDDGDDEDKAFRCTECDFCSDCRRKYLSHYELTHVAPANFTCELCLFTSSVVEERDHHLETKHNVCAECDHCAGDYEEIMRHAANHSRKRLRSETAALQQERARSMADHDATISHDAHNNNNNVGDFACSHCDYRAKRSPFLKRHVKARHADKNFMCTLCNFRSAQRWCVKQHIVEVHKKLRLYLCPHCQHRAGSKGNLNLHVRTVHLKDRQILNRQAGYSAKYTASKKKSWVQQPRQQQPGTFACNFCGYETSVEFDLYRHIRDEHAILNLAEAAAPDAAAPAAVAIQKTAVTAQEEDDLPPPPPPNVVTLDEAGLRSGKISIVCE